MPLPTDMWKMREKIPTPTRGEVNDLAVSMWSKAAVHRALTYDMATGLASMVSRFVWALLVIHKLQSRIKVLEEEVVKLKAAAGDVSW